jgi:hypothetical protein
MAPPNMELLLLPVGLYRYSKKNSAFADIGRVAPRMAEIITITTREASIKRRLRRHLAKLGFHKNSDGLLEI